jgi:hypothetical protein
MSRLATLLGLVVLAGCDAADPAPPDQIAGETIAVPALVVQDTIAVQ